MKEISLSSRMQADDFLEAYSTLEKNYDSVTLAVMGPSVVCLAFAVELYIKDIYFALKREPPSGRDGHNILKLFEALPPETQKEIFSHKAISQNPFSTRGDIFSSKRYTSSDTAYDGFIYELTAISNGFNNWRYSFESRVPLKYSSSFALAFIEAIKSVADVIRYAHLHKR